MLFIVYNLSGDVMLQIQENISNEIVIKNSKFICFLYNVSTIDSINSILEKTRKDYKDATHICYAYRLEKVQKYSDDGEPGGTAGAPIMNVLEKNNVTNILAIVVRYFGGIKLGAGGLIRAYSKATREALSHANTDIVVFYDYYELISTYDDLKLLNSITKNLDIIEKEFKENIVYKIKIEKDKDITEICLQLKNTNIRIIKLS